VFGAVQGVGFRPFVYRLARELGLWGMVRNCSSGVEIEVEGREARVRSFAARLETEAPAVAVVLAIETSVLDPAGYEEFSILPSDESASKTCVVLPDLATCSDCRAEIADPANRRFRYAFTNCTHCGPRFTILQRIPYDRPNTSMAGFTLCEQCRREYTDPGDRRFHAQPNACPDCGPQLEFVGPDGIAVQGYPLELAVEWIRQGKIVALKGIGGFQLLADATSNDAVRRLRQRKQREAKPFAVMFPSLDVVTRYCRLDAPERALLSSPAAPIVLLRPGEEARLAGEVTACSPSIGAMIPYSPLHHLLMEKLDCPVIATSGNRSEEPIAIENQEALDRLNGIADAYLLHNRPIQRPCDDSVARVILDREVILRRARGYAPLPVRVPRPLGRILAVGAHLKNTVAISVGRQIFVGQHVGDLETPQSRQAFHREIDDLSRLYEFEPEAVACDLHPDYYSTRYAESSGLPLVKVQHHQAHVAACAAENDLRGEYLGVAWDGTGYGFDHTVWGGEFFRWDSFGFTRIAHPRQFHLPGGDRAVLDARRTAWSLLHETFGKVDWPELGLSESELSAFPAMIQQSLQAPRTTSIGRLFDACAVLLGLGTRNRFEGQLPMLLEAAIGSTEGAAHYPVCLIEGETLSLDWRPMVEALSNDVRRGCDTAEIALKLHNTLAEWIVEVARVAAVERVVLSGGVFQNACLVARASKRLREAGFRPYTHQRIPPNDGGIALGQAVLAGLHLEGKVALPQQAARAGNGKMEDDVRCV